MWFNINSVVRFIIRWWWWSFTIRLSRCFDNLNSYQEAQNQYRQVLQIDPKHFGAYEKLALIKQTLKNETVSAQKEVSSEEQGIILVP